jgi:hypothetical protein
MLQRQFVSYARFGRLGVSDVFPGFLAPDGYFWFFTFPYNTTPHSMCNVTE